MTNTVTPHPTGPRYVAPELHFFRKQVPLGKPDSEKMVEVSQLVRKGAVLANFPEYHKMKKKGFLRSPIEPGANVLFDEKSFSLIAEVPGYPKASYVVEEGEPDILIIDIIPVLKISHDKMQASLVIHPAIPNLPSLKTEAIDELIKEAGVTYGIMQKAIDKAQKSIHSEYADFDDIIIAKGRFPGEGQDAYLQFELEIGPLAGHLLEDGSIDFRERKIMVGVKENQHLATKIPPVPGEEGYNVLGESIEPKTGKDLTVRVQGNAAFNSENNTVTATRDGTMSVVKKNTIKVASKVTIKGDIDYNTGNLETENNATISGDIQPGFKVTVGGDLDIRGNVTSAVVFSAGNTIIHGGISGVKSTVESQGDLNINFTERAAAKAGGVTVVRKQVYYSTIETGLDLRCATGSTIVGGTIIAGGSITVANVGSENSKPALIAAGVDAERYHLHLELGEQYKEQQEQIIQALQLSGSGRRPKKIRKMEEEAHETRMKMLKLNLIPGTELYSRLGSGNTREDLEDLHSMYHKGINIEDIRIEVTGKIYAGTVLMIGNRKTILSENVEKRCYRLSKNLKRLMAIPL